MIRKLAIDSIFATIMGSRIARLRMGVGGVTHYQKHHIQLRRFAKYVLVLVVG
jgi:hypothetical protein